MKKKLLFAKISAIAGSVLLWAPILFMVVLAVIGSIQSGKLLFDYLMLAELFLAVIIGAALLIVCGFLSHLYTRWLLWATAAAVLALAASQIYAVASGLAHGTTSPDGFAFALVIALIVIYNLLVLGIAVIGILQIKALFQKNTTAVTVEKESGE
ncbi:MAG TPA: hypothetical protein P5075_00550 [Eubacteriales bacterium]|nr:hypothetical protein [Eubacteriales bacterium]